jgi:hypothetical protein
MAPTDNSNWAVLRELALDRFPEDAEVADAMRWAEELAVQQPSVAAEEEAARVAARTAEVALDLAAREEAVAAEEVAREAARALSRLSICYPVCNATTGPWIYIYTASRHGVKRL